MKRSRRVKMSESDLCNILRWYSIYAESLLTRTLASDIPAVERALSVHSAELVSRLMSAFDDQVKACEVAKAVGGEEAEANDGEVDVPEEITGAV